MTDTSQGRVTSPVADDDPFAELTRIMGFDPREPVSRPAPTAAPNPQRQVAQSDDRSPSADADDLEIDLERELMGEFIDDEPRHGNWDAVSDHADDPEPHADAPRGVGEQAGADFWAHQPANGAPLEQPASDAHEASAEAVSGGDWEIDLAADMLSGVGPADDTAPDDAPTDADLRVEDVSAHRAMEEAPQARAAEASREPFVSEVDLPPIPLSRAAEPAIEPVAQRVSADAFEESGLDLALEHELGAVLAHPVEDHDWHHGADDRHADGDRHASVSAAGVEDVDHGTDEQASDHDGAGSADRDGHDPYAALAALTAGLHDGMHRNQPGSEAHPEEVARAKVAAEVPDIETVEVPEQGVPVAEELDIPEIHFEEQPPVAGGYDDIDAEFASLLNEMNSLDRSSVAAAPVAGWQPFEPVPAQQGKPVATPAAVTETGRRYAVDADYLDAARGEAQTDIADMEFAFDPDAEEDVAPAIPTARRPLGRGYLMATALVCVAVLGGLAVFMLPFGSGDGDSEIALVEADPSPTKVRPENPGGVVIPNQDNKVYDRVAGAGVNEAPTQEKLLQSAEEPLELPMPRDEEAADLAPFPGDVDGTSVKAEDRIVPLSPEEEGVDTTMEVAAVAPRKVRTMVVKADGTLVAREVPVQDADLPAEDGMGPALDPIASATTSVDDEMGIPVDEPAAEQSAVQDGGAATEASAAEAPAAAAPAANAASTPNAAPIAPSRPSDQPVDIVGEVQPNQQVAALAPAPAGAWSMQIASQPSEAAAQASHRDLQRRYASVLEGRPVNIVKADIPGKGTFWRVRVPAATRAEAVQLCETYKAAGGSCFVSK